MWKSLPMNPKMSRIVGTKITSTLVKARRATVMEQWRHHLNSFPAHNSWVMELRIFWRGGKQKRHFSLHCTSQWPSPELDLPPESILTSFSWTLQIVMEVERHENNFFFFLNIYFLHLRGSTVSVFGLFFSSVTEIFKANPVINKTQGKTSLSNKNKSQGFL